MSCAVRSRPSFHALFIYVPLTSYLFPSQWRACLLFCCDVTRELTSNETNFRSGIRYLLLGSEGSAFACSVYFLKGD